MIKDPIILLSYINTKLRDHYLNLDTLCEDLNLNKAQINDILNKKGYYYDSILNKFVYKGDMK